MMKYYPVSCVLIETYWNVNANENQPQRGTAAVLIETYWNVNIWCNITKKSG